MWVFGRGASRQSGRRVNDHLPCRRSLFMRSKTSISNKSTSGDRSSLADIEERRVEVCPELSTTD